MRSLAAALSFLTRLPVGRFVRIGADDVAHCGGWFPLIGILLGAIYGGAAIFPSAGTPAISRTLRLYFWSHWTPW